MMAKLTAGPLSGKRGHRAANYDSGFADMPTLTDLVEAIRPIQESYAGS
jgi:hypothetical protein